MTAAQLIRAVRRRRGLTQEDLGALVGTSQAAVARLERPGANPTVATLERLMAAAGHRLELGASEHASSVDETLVASYMRMTPAERLRSFQSSHESVERLRAVARDA